MREVLEVREGVSLGAEAEAMIPLHPTPRFDSDARAEIGKAVAIAGLSALATKLVEWGVDEAKAWWEARKAKGEEKR